MNLFNKVLIILTIIFPPQSYAHKICLSGHIFKEFNSYGESFKNAVQIALEETNNKDNSLEAFFYDKKPLSAITIYKKMIQSKCTGIIGYSYLSDLLTLNNAVKLDKNIKIFSPYATTHSHDLQENIHTMRPNQLYLAKKSAHFIKKRLGFNNVTIITDLRRIEMNEYKKAYIKVFSDLGIKFSIIDTIKDDLKISINLNSSRENILLLLTGTNLAAKIIQNTQYKSTYWGTETFGSKSSQSLMNLLDKSKKSRIYSTRNLAYDNKDNKRKLFYNKYIEKFKKKPTMLSLYAYDASRVLLSPKSNIKGVTGMTFNNGIFNNSKYYSIIKPSEAYKIVESN